MIRIWLGMGVKPACTSGSPKVTARSSFALVVNGPDLVSKSLGADGFRGSPAFQGYVRAGGPLALEESGSAPAAQ